MQASQRAVDNPALDFAAARANEMRLPVLACFGLTPQYPEANLRHYTFMMEGLDEARRGLARSGVRLAVIPAAPDAAALALCADAALVVCDCGYLRIQRAWRARVAEQSPCPVFMVEADAVVPVETASAKAEWSAATLRPKIHRLLGGMLPLKGEAAPAGAEPELSSLRVRLPVETVVPGPRLLDELAVDRSIGPAAGLRGGTEAGLARLRSFTESRLPYYAEEANDPAADVRSGLSPYLHFGQISPLRILREVMACRSSPEAAREKFLEELVVRRELALNWVRYADGYDTYAALPRWARETLEAHAADPRPRLYTAAELEQGRTHDRLWNAAAREMRIAGTMHGHMRMYWAKKILEWSRTPQEAFAAALRLNNRYFMDGRDPCSYAGVAWCFGLHDRPWPQRPVFGTVRAMTAGGLERKFDMDVYVDRVEALR
jgi:deoxyribodipyrimidine photo-lyase